MISYPDEIAQDLIQQLTEYKGQYTGFLTIGVAVTPYRLDMAHYKIYKNFRRLKLGFSNYDLGNYLLSIV